MVTIGIKTSPEHPKEVLPVKKPVVDITSFRISKINEPQYRHLKYLLGWVGYFVFFFLTENLIPPEHCYSVHCLLDDLIPFWDIFVIPYVFWYFWIVIALFYFGLYKPDGFKGLMTFIIVTQIVAMACYILWPTRQDLRPDTFPTENILTRIMGLVYAIDTNTGVCPSLHAAYSIGIASAICKERDLAGWIRVSTVMTAIVICLSTMFVKQHSALDVLAALPLCVLAEIIAYGKNYWAPRFKKQP